MHKTVMLLAAALLLAAGPATAQMVVYPAQNQTPEQQEADQQACYQWAVQQTGIDPATMTPPAQVAAPNDHKPLRGAVAGAAVGGLGGSLGGEFGKGAAAGAAVGAVVGGIRKHRERKATESVNAQAQAQYNQAVQNHLKAYQACLEGRGYTVK